MTQFRPGGFQSLPLVIKNLVIINVLVFLAQITLGDGRYFNMENLFALHHVKSPLFQPWQIITHLFLHGGWGHLFFNMLSLWMFGSVLESLWGPKKFLTFYFICGIGAALIHLTFLWFDNAEMLNQFVSIKDHATPGKVSLFFSQFNLTRYEGAAELLDAYTSNPGDPGNLHQVMAFVNEFTVSKLNIATIGASGAIAGVLAGFFFLFPNTEIYLYFFIPIKAKWLGILYFGQELYFGITNAQGDNIAHWAHIGGALVGFLLVLTWNKTNRRNFY